MTRCTRTALGAPPVRFLRRRLPRVCCRLAMVAVTCLLQLSTAWATAPTNSGGVLLLHVERETPYEYGTFDHCGELGLTAPASAATRLPGDGIPRLVGIYAVFPLDSIGAIRAFSFGVRYTENVRIVGQVPCNAGGMAISMAGWPASGGGISVHIPSEVETRSRVIPLYWFAVLSKGPGSIELTPHPMPKLAGRFVTIEVPYEQEPIVGYGRIGFNQDGFEPSPGPRAVLAPCCVKDECWLLARPECETYHGDFLGVGMTCDNRPCRDDAYLGGCCLPEGCKMLTLVDCSRDGGSPLGEGVQCDSLPCPKPAGAGASPE